MIISIIAITAWILVYATFTAAIVIPVQFPKLKKHKTAAYITSGIITLGIAFTCCFHLLENGMNGIGQTLPPLLAWLIFSAMLALDAKRKPHPAP